MRLKQGQATLYPPRYPGHTGTYATDAEEFLYLWVELRTRGLEVRIQLHVVFL